MLLLCLLAQKIFGFNNIFKATYNTKVSAYSVLSDNHCFSFKVYYDYYTNNPDLDSKVSISKVGSNSSKYFLNLLRPAYIRIFKPTLASGRSFVFLIEPGDDLTFRFEKAKVTCYGKGAEKINLQLKLSTLNSDIEDHGSNIYESLVAFKLSYDSIFKLKENIVNNFNFKNNIVRELLNADLIADHQMLIINKFLLYSHFNTSETDRNLLRKFYFDHLKGYDAIVDEKLAIFSKNFSEYLFQKLFIELYVKENFKTHTFSELYFLIDSSYSGEIKEKLLTTLFINKFDTDSKAWLLIDPALSLIKNYNYQFPISQIKMSRQPGADVYNFSLKDSIGIIHRLKDYQGKVVMLEFWFTGCYACSQLNKILVPFRNRYNSLSSDIAFISISTDKNREVWIKSLKKGEYTSDDEINLYTGGLGNDDELIRFYNFNSYPRLILVNKQGKLVTSDVIYPVDSLSKSNLYNLIDSLIAN